MRLESRILSVILIALCSVLAVYGFAAWDAYRHAEDDLAAEAWRTARLARSAYEQTLAGVVGGLRAIGAAPAACVRIGRTMVPAGARMRVAVLVAGRASTCTIGDVDETPEEEWPPQPAAPEVSTVEAGRDAAGRPVLHLSVRTSEDAGSVLALMDARALESIPVEASMAPGTVLLLVDGRGILAMHQSDRRRDAGVDISASSLWRRLLAGVARGRPADDPRSAGR